MGEQEENIRALERQLAATHGPVLRMLSPVRDPQRESMVWLVKDRKVHKLMDDKVVPLHRIRKFGFNPDGNRDLLIDVPPHPGVPAQYSSFQLEQYTPTVSSARTSPAATHEVWPYAHSPAALSLRSLLQRGNIEPGSVLPYLIECAKIAQHLHENGRSSNGPTGVIHTDYKPSNFLAHVKARDAGRWRAIKTDEEAYSLPVNVPVFLHHPVAIDFEVARRPGEPIISWSVGFSHPLLDDKHSTLGTDENPLFAVPAADVRGLCFTGLALAEHTKIQNRYPWADVVSLAERCLDGEQYNQHITTHDLLRVLTRHRTMKRAFFAGVAFASLATLSVYAHKQQVVATGTPLLEQFHGTEAQQQELYGLLSGRLAEDVEDRRFPLPESGNAPTKQSPTEITSFPFTYDYGGAATRMFLLAAKREPQLLPWAVRHARAQLEAQKEGFKGGEGHNLFVLPLAELADYLGERTVEDVTPKMLREAVRNAAEHVRGYIERHPKFNFYPYERRSPGGERAPDKLSSRDSKSVYQTLLPASELFYRDSTGKSDPFLEAAIKECLALRALLKDGVMQSDFAFDTTAQDVDPRPRSLGQAQYAKALYSVADMIERRRIPEHAALAAQFRTDVHMLLQPFLNGDPGVYLDTLSPRNAWDAESAAIAFETGKKSGLDVQPLLTRLVREYVPRATVKSYLWRERSHTAVLTHLCRDIGENKKYWCKDSELGSPLSAEPFLEGLAYVKPKYVR